MTSIYKGRRIIINSVKKMTVREDGQELLEMKDGHVIRRDSMDSELNSWNCPNLRTAQRVRPAQFEPRTKGVREEVAKPVAKKPVEEAEVKRKTIVVEHGCSKGAPGPVGLERRWRRPRVVVRRRGRVHYGGSPRRVVKVIEHHHIYHK